MSLNRHQRRHPEKKEESPSRSWRTDSSQPLKGTSNLSNVSPPLSPDSERLSQTTTEQNLFQKAPQSIPPPPIDSPTRPPVPPTSGTANSTSESELPAGLEPLKPKEQKLANDLTQSYFLLGNLASTFSPFSSTLITLTANKLAEDHVRMARHIPGYYKFLEKMVSINDYTPFILSHSTLIGVILAHHDLVQGAAKEHYQQLGAAIFAQYEAVLNNGTNQPGAIPSMA